MANKLSTTKQANQYAMSVLANMKPCNNSRYGDALSAQSSVQSRILDAAIDALYSQNKLIDAIIYLEENPSFEPNPENVIGLLKSFLAGNKDSVIKED